MRRLRLEALEDRRLLSLAGTPPLGGLEWPTQPTDEPTGAEPPADIAFSGEAGILTAAPATPDLLDLSDTGVSNTDNLTNLDNSAPEKALRFSVGSTIAGATVTLYADGVAIGIALAEGATTIIATNGSFDLADGTRSITARQVLPGEEESTDSAVLEVTIDTVAPFFLSPTRLGGYDTSGSALGVALSGTLAYVVDGSAGLQIIDVSNPAAPVRLGGYDTSGEAWAVAVSGTLAYVADGYAGLQIIDVSNPAAPVRLGAYDTSGNAYGVAIVGTVAYAADGGAGLQIIDVTDPRAPVRLGGYDTSGFASGVAVVGTVAYVADGGAGLQIIDVTNPAAPVRLGGYDTGGFAWSVAVSGTLAYVADRGAGLQIIDMSNPAAPVRLGGYDTGGDAHDVAVSGTLAYVADGSAGLQVIDVADPTAPSWLGVIDTSGSASAVAVLGTVAYVADVSGGLAVVDVSPLGPLPAPDLQAASDTGISSTDNITGDNTPTFDVSIPGKAYFRFYRDGVQISGDYETGASYATPLQPDGTYAYSVLAVDAAGNASAPSPTLSVTVERSIPSAPDLLAGSDSGASDVDDVTNLDNSAPEKSLQFSVGNTIVGATVTLYADGTAVGSAVADSDATTITTNGSFDLTDGLRAITARQTMPGEAESTDSAALEVRIDTAAQTVFVKPVRLGGYDTSGYAYGVAVVGTRAYVADGYAGLVIIDITNPAAPVRLGAFDTSGEAEDVAVSGTLAYVADYSAGLQIIDVSNPAAPVRLGGYDTSGSACGVAVAGTLAYVADSISGLQIIDVSNPAAPVRLGGYNTSGYAYGVVIVGTLAYVADYDAGLVIVDVSDPAAPQRLGALDINGLVHDVAVFGTRAYLAADGSGLQIIDVSDPTAPVQLAAADTSGRAFGVAVSGTLAYVADYTAGLQIIDVSDPGAPVRLGGYDTAGYAYGVAVSGTLAYVADEYRGLQIIEVSSLATPPAPDLQPASDTGANNADNITGDNTPTFSVSMPDGFYFRFYRDGVQVSGDFESGSSYTTPVQPNGLFGYAVAAVDPAGNVSPLSPVLSVTIDSSIPPVPDLLATSDTGVSNTDNITNLDNSTAEKMLQFSVGNTIAGATVTLYADGNAIGSAVADGATTTITTNGSLDLTDGQHAITARQTLPGKAESTDSVRVYVTIDTVGPGALSPPDLQAASDTGISNTDDLTGDNTPTFVVSAAAGPYFRFHRDGVQISGDYESGSPYTAPVQADGAYSYSVLAVDTAGNVSAPSAALSVTIDTTIPSAPDLLPVSDTGISTTDNLTNLDNSTVEKALQFAVGNTVPGATVTLYADGVAIGSATAEAGTVTVTVTTNGTLALLDGVHSIMARQTLAGEEESPISAILTLTVDTTPPAPLPVPDLQFASDTGISNTDNITTDTTPTFSVSRPAGSYFRFYRDGVQISGDWETGNPNSAYTTVVQADGTYGYAIAAVDAAGNVSALSPALSVTIDTTIPSAPDLLPLSDTGISGADNLTNLDNSTPEKVLQFTVGNTIAGATVTVYADGAAIGSALADGATTTITANGSFDLTDGQHAITARQALPGRPESTDSAALRVTVDTTAPAPPSAPDLQPASDTGISNTDNITNDTTPTFLISVPAFRLYRDGVQISGDRESGASYTTPLQPDGTYEYSVAAVDDAGNVSDPSPALSVTIDSTIPSAPDLLAAYDTGFWSIDNTTNLDNSAPEERLQFAVGNTIAGATVTLYADGAAIGSAVADGATTTITTNGGFDLADGPHAITARQTLPGGTESPPSAGLTLTIDTTPPAQPAAPDLQASSDTGISDADNLTGNFTLTFAISVSPERDFRFYRDGVQISGDYERGLVHTAIAQPDGTHAYCVTAVDVAGNVSALSPALWVTIDASIPPAPDLLDISDTGVSSSDNVTNLDNGTPESVLQFSVGNTIAGATVTLYADGTAIGSAVAEGATTTITTNGSFDLTDGLHSITARQTAPGEDESPLSAALEVTIDTVASFFLTPVSLGAYNTSGNACGVALSGTLAYVADGGAGLVIIDVTNPAAPARLGGYDTSGIAYDVVVSGTLAYVADESAGLQIIDVSSPANPVRLGGYDTSGYARGVAVSGTLVYVADSYAGLVILDVTDPTAPVRLGGYDTSGYACDVVVFGTLAYVADGGAGLVILDITNPAAPVWLGGYDTSGSVYDVAVSGTLAYMADRDAGLQIIDVANPAAPARLGGFDTDGSAWSVAVVGTLAYVADGIAGLQIIDLADPTAPARLGGYDTSGNARGVAVLGTQAYLAGDVAGLQILDVSQQVPPPAPDLQAASDTGTSYSDNVTTQNRPTFDLTLPSGSYFRFYCDGVQISGDCESGATYTTAVQPDGTHGYAVAAVDAAGNVSPASAALSVTIGTTMPSEPDLLTIFDTGNSPTDNVTALDNSTPEKSLGFSIGGTLAGATVTLYADDVAIGSAVATTMTTTITSNGAFDLADGTHAITARQTLPGRLASAKSAVRMVTIDTLAPDPPPAPDLQAASDTGISDRDNLTADRTPTFDIFVPAGSGFRVYRDGVQISADRETGAVFTAPTQSDGTYEFTVAAIDTAGNVSNPSPALSVTIHTWVLEAPDRPTMISDTGVSSTDNLTNLDNSRPDKALRFTVGNTCPGTYVDLYADGVAIGTALATDWTTTVTTRGDRDLADGSHAITARLRAPEAGESPSSPALVITIDTVAATYSSLVRVGGYNVAGGQVFSVALAGTRAYLAAGSAGLVILDVTNPAAPVPLGGYDTSGTAYDVAVSGTLAYVADGDGGLVILDVSGPAAPMPLGRLDTWAAVNKVTLSGPLAYVVGVGPYGEPALGIIDVANPTTPSQLGFTRMGWNVGDVAVDGTRAYLAAGGVELDILDVMNPDTPVYLGELHLWGLSAFSRSVAVVGTRAYVADGDLQIVDITNPAAPKKLGRLSITGGTLDVAVSGTRAYVASWAGGLAVVDVTNPDAPVQVSAYDTSGDAWKVAVAGTLVYVAEGAQGLAIVEMMGAPVLQPASDTGLSSIDNVTADNTPTFDIAVPSGLYYRVLRNGAQISADCESGRSFTAPVQVDGTSAYAVTIIDAAGNASAPSVTISVTVDTSIPSAPDLLPVSDTGLSNTDNVTNLDNSRPERALQFAVGGTIAGATVTVYADGTAIGSALAAGSTTTVTTNGSFHLVDRMHWLTARQTRPGWPESAASAALTVTVDTISPDLLDLVPVGAYDTRGGAFSVVVSGTRAYVADLDSGLQIIDVTDPAAPARLGGYDTTGSARAVAVSGTLAYVADYAAGLVIIDVSNPAAPVRLGGYRTTGNASDVAVSGTLAYVTAEGEGLVIVDVSNPAAPRRLGGYDTPGYAEGVAVSGTVAYVADAGAGLLILDVTNAAAPVRLGRLDTSGLAYGIAVLGNVVYVADDSAGLKIIDVMNPAAPALLASYETRGYAKNVAVCGTLAYVAEWEAGVEILDVTNPAQPGRLGGHNTSGYASGVAASGTLAYVADYGPGLVAVDLGRLVPPAPDLQPSSDTGISNTDNVTADNTPAFDLLLPGEPYFRVYCDGIQISGDYETGTSFAAPVQPDGTSDYTVAAVDTAGNLSPQSPPLRVTIDTTAPTVATSVVNGGAAQRSQISSLAIRFSEDVSGSLGVTDLTLVNRDSGAAVSLSGVVPGYDATTQTATWDLSGIAIEDGYYRATLQAFDISDVAGTPLAGGNYPIDFFRLLGDTDGNAAIDIFDVANVQVNYGQTSGMSPAEGDFDGNGTVDIFDVALLQVQYGKTLTAPAPMPAAAPEAGSTSLPLVAAQPGHSPAECSEIAASFGGGVSGPPSHFTRSVESTDNRQGWASHAWHTSRTRGVKSMGAHFTRSVKSTMQPLAVHHAGENVAWALAVDELLEVREA